MDSLFIPLLIGCVLALASALGVVLARRPIYAAIFLLGHSLSLAGLFALLSSAMVAVGQVIIYSGAIVVLFLFVVTLLPSGGSERNLTGGRVAAAIVAGGGLLVALAAGLAGATLPAISATRRPERGRRRPRAVRSIAGRLRADRAAAAGRRRGRRGHLASPRAAAHRARTVVRETEPRRLVMHR